MYIYIYIYIAGLAAPLLQLRFSRDLCRPICAYMHIYMYVYIYTERYNIPAHKHKQRRRHT